MFMVNVTLFHYITFNFIKLVILFLKILQLFMQTYFKRKPDDLSNSTKKTQNKCKMIARKRKQSHSLLRLSTRGCHRMFPKPSVTALPRVRLVWRGFKVVASSNRLKIERFWRRNGKHTFWRGFAARQRSNLALVAQLWYLSVKSVSLFWK